MCGIIGAFSWNDFEVTEPYIIKMRDEMTHRGPDGAGVWISSDRSIGLGHRRLSIIDLSTAASQPMMTQDQRFVLTFNGEIYNHAEIKRELITLGHVQWQTDHSDTEVLLQAFSHWGIQALHKLRGMFAFGIWDNLRRELWLVRDRLGIKPLYYSIHHNRLVFASEIKALLADSEQPRAVNTQGFYHYLSFLTTPAPMTLFSGIQKLEAGCWLRIRANGEIEHQRYWEVWDHLKSLDGFSEEVMAELILTELKNAVSLHKDSDVPVGVFLSGGIDSSTNAALFSENGTNPIHTFSIGYQGEYDSYKNELDYARFMAKQINAHHFEKLLTLDELLDFLPKMVELQDEPIADPVCFPVYYVSKLAKDHGVTVCQVGEGADELFWGYNGWKTKLNFQRLGNIPFTRPLQKASLGLVGQYFGKNSLHYETLRRSSQGLPIFWGGAEAFTEHQKQELLHPALKAELGGITSWEALEPIWKRYQAKAPDHHPLNWMTYLDLNMRLAELLLMRVDKMAMGVSLEGRVPFLDHKFVELAMSIPAALKTKNGVLKYMLKKAVRGTIPDVLIDRKKQGFGVPVYEWLFDKLGDFTRQTIREVCQKTEFFNPKAIDILLQGNQGKMDTRVWYILNFCLWWKQYL